MNETSHRVVDATIRKYLSDKVRERFREDVHLIEPMLEEFVSRYSLKELFMRCSIEISRLKNHHKRENNGPLMR